MDGKIDSAELKAVLASELSDVGDKEWHDLLDEADENKDGHIDIHDFFRMMYGAESVRTEVS